MSMVCNCTHDAAVHYNGGPCAAHRCSCEWFRQSLKDKSDEYLVIGLLKAKIADQTALIDRMKAAMKFMVEHLCSGGCEAACTGIEGLRAFLDDAPNTREAK